MLKWVLTIVGLLCVGLAALGLFLPILPTTPFLLLAAACFAKSSEKFYNWLLSNAIFGEMIHHWHTTRSMPRKSKHIAISSVVLVGGSSVIFFIEPPMLKLLTLALLLIPIVILSRIPCSEAQYRLGLENGNADR